MVREASRVVLEVHDDARPDIGRDVHNVLPGVGFPWLQRDRLAGVHVGLVQNLELDQVHMHRVVGTGRVLELPDLAGAEYRELGDIIPELAGDVTVRAIQ